MWYVGRISGSKDRFTKTIILDERNSDTPKFENVAEFERESGKQAHIYLPDFLQGSHAPDRQVFMSAAVDMIKQSETDIEILEIGAYAVSSMLT